MWFDLVRRARGGMSWRGGFRHDLSALCSAATLLLVGRTQANEPPLKCFIPAATACGSAGHAWPRGRLWVVAQGDLVGNGHTNVVTANPLSITMLAPHQGSLLQAMLPCCIVGSLERRAGSMLLALFVESIGSLMARPEYWHCCAGTLCSSLSAETP